MFTGIIKSLGEIEKINSRPGGRRLTIDTGGELEKPITTGDSLAVDGVCLTVETSSPAVRVAVSAETLEKTTLSGYNTGDRVNLEPAVAAGEALGGHFVTGHVDGTVPVKKLVPRGDDYNLVVEFPDRFAPYLVEKGAVTLAGISLTVNECGENKFTCRVVPHTYKNTTLHRLGEGDRLNIEIDILARYTENILKYNKSRPDELSADKLREAGF